MRTKPTGTGKGWQARIIISIGVGLLAYILLPRLQFVTPAMPSMAGVYAFVMACFAFVMQTPFFLQHISRIKWVVMVMLVIIVSINAALQFRWIEANPWWSWMATVWVLPVGVVWMVWCANMNLGNQQMMAFAAAPWKRRQTKEEQKLVTTMAPWKLRLSAIWLFAGIAFVFLVGMVVLFYRLGYYDFWEDEGLVMRAAIDVRDNGMNALWQGGYDRAWLHSILVSQSIQVFGESEWSARLPSALFGVIFIFVAAWVMYKWFGNVWLALAVPLTCILLDEFVILFRYTRMYAPMIPVFLAGMYCLFRFLVSPLHIQQDEGKKKLFGFNVKYGIAAFALMAVAMHLHPLSAIGFLGALALLVMLAVVTRMNVYWYVLGAGVVLGSVCLLLGYMGVDSFRFVTAAIRRMMRPDRPEFAYYQFMFNNGLPTNAIIMTMAGGTGLFFNNSLDRTRKLALAFMYALIIMTMVFMVYLMADTGRDYRYIAHMVPLVIGVVYYVLWTSGNDLHLRGGMLVLLLPLIFAAISFSREYKELYVRHPWSPQYKVAYADIRDRYTPGESILYQNMKSYYLDPKTLAGDKAFQLGRRKEMTLDQFRQLYEAQSAGWIVFDTHKSYHLHQEIIKYIIRHAEKVHGSGADDTGVEVFYFNNDTAVNDE